MPALAACHPCCRARTTVGSSGRSTALAAHVPKSADPQVRDLRAPAPAAPPRLRPRNLWSVDGAGVHPQCPLSMSGQRGGGHTIHGAEVGRGRCGHPSAAQAGRASAHLATAHAVAEGLRIHPATQASFDAAGDRQRQGAARNRQSQCRGPAGGDSANRQTRSKAKTRLGPRRFPRQGQGFPIPRPSTGLLPTPRPPPRQRGQPQWAILGARPGRAGRRSTPPAPPGARRAANARAPASSCHRRAGKDTWTVRPEPPLAADASSLSYGGDRSKAR